MFDHIDKFESTIAEYFGSLYAVAVDSCTHGIELALRLQNITSTQCPKHTYLSIPMTLTKLNINWGWSSAEWEDYYFLKDTNIADAAVLWKENSYIPGTLMVLSFQFKKHLSLGRGGIILLDNFNDYQKLVRMSYDGRSRCGVWAEQDITSIGYHYYMTPETAITGINKFNQVKHAKPRQWSSKDYPDLSTMTVFSNVK